MNTYCESSALEKSNSADSEFHIAFCVDRGYFLSMGATIVSIIKNNPNVKFVFHVMTFAMPDADRSRLEDLERKFNVRVIPHVIDQDIFKQFSHLIKYSHYSLSTFTRLIVPNILKGVTSRVLYLDADILCVGKINELIELNINDEIAVVAPDAEVTMRRRCKALNLKTPLYFNGGFLFMNIEKWIENKISEQAIEILVKESKKLRFNDQDALNIVLDGRIRYIETKWNYLYGLVGDLEIDKRKMDIKGDAVFIHFAGAVKPWNNWNGHDSKDLFMEYHSISPWLDVPIDEVPQNYKEMRMFSRFLFKRRQFLSSITWYFRYLSKKVSHMKIAG